MTDLTPHQRLQAAMVRLLVDPAAVDALHAGRTPTGLTPDQAALLRAVDRRAWSVDSFRRARLLHAVLDELPVTVGLLGLPAADAFFSSDTFGRVLTSRGSLTLAFGAWAGGRAGYLGRLELDLARLRRWRPPRGPGLARAAAVGLIDAPPGAPEQLAALAATLAPDPAAALAAGRRLTAPPARRGAERLLVTPGPAGAAFERPPAALADLLAASTHRRARAEVAAQARRLGAGDEADAVVQSLLDDGLLHDGG
jgi:hypothetical protein